MKSSNVDPRLRAHWYPVVRDDLLGDDPIRVQICGEAIAVVRLDGEPAAMVDRCPHRDARLSDGAVVDGCLQCPYHGWLFAADGACTLIPALGPESAAVTRTPATALPTRVEHGLVFVALEEPRSDLLEVPEWGDPRLGVAWLPVVTIRAGAAQFIDNFLDFAHFPFVHAGTFGTDDDRLVGDYEVERVDDGLRLRYEHLVHHHEDPGVATGERPLLQPRVMEYTWRLPFVARLRLEYPVAGIENTIVVWAVPETADTTVLHTVLLRDDIPPGDEAAAQGFADYEMSVLAEDLLILERLPDTQLELDPRARMQTRADRLTVEFRRILGAALES